MSIKDKKIMITGGTGSFGNKVVKLLYEMNPKKIIVYSRDEKKQYEMKKKFPDIHYIIGDVRDFENIKYSMRGIDYVFHAAALKQVPNCELYPMEAVKTNIIGSDNVFKSACLNGAEKVVCLSTDKSVKPINSMGLTKGLMEKIALSYNNDETKFCCVRYGNVMASRGSVIPFFKNIILEGDVVPITNPDMTRFMLSLKDACELVFYAFNNSNGGEVFVKKAPSCTVEFLSYFMHKFYGKENNNKIIGTRPGEKIHEVLINEYEYLRSEDMGDYYIIHKEGNYENKHLVEDCHEYTSENTKRINVYEEFLPLYENIEEDLI